MAEHVLIFILLGALFLTVRAKDKEIAWWRLDPEERVRINDLKRVPVPQKPIYSKRK